MYTDTCLHTHVNVFIKGDLARSRYSHSAAHGALFTTTGVNNHICVYVHICMYIYIYIYIYMHTSLHL